MAPQPENLGALQRNIGPCLMRIVGFFEVTFEALVAGGSFNSLQCCMPRAGGQYIINV